MSLFSAGLEALFTDLCSLMLISAAKRPKCSGKWLSQRLQPRKHACHLFYAL